MGTKNSAFRGCFLGMAVGDAMGLSVNKMTWEEICENYGPNGLLGYDLRNDSAEVSSYTQVAAYVTNGLLLAINRGKTGTPIPFVAEAMRQWAKRQHFPRDPEKNLFWVSQISQLRKRQCMDAWMLDATRFATLGTPEKPINQASTPGAIMTGAAIGLYYDPKRMEPGQIGPTAVQAVALTHGDPEAFLSAAVLSYVIYGLLHHADNSLKEQFLRAVETVDRLFREKYPQTTALSTRLKLAIGLADNQNLEPRQRMEQLCCNSAGECLAAAMYACLASNEDFDTAMILSVNHSGRSSAVGAITGAILGTKLTEDALPEFYLESLEAADVLRTLADDLVQGSPTVGLFDDDWDHKYSHGIPV